MRRIVLTVSTVLALVVVAVSTAAAALVWPSAASGHSKRCGRVVVPTREVKAKVRAVKGSVSCRRARRVIRTAYHAEDTRHWDGTTATLGIYWRVHHWRCFTGLGGSQTFCYGHRKQVDGSTRRGDGWSF